MRSFRHWTARYLFHRVVDIVYRRSHPDHPWLTPNAISILEAWLQTTDVGFEWGGGRSTFWFGRRVRHLTSIEHDPVWYRKLLGSLAEAKIENVDFQLRSLEGAEKSDYLLAMVRVPAESLDFVLVDGRLRHLCVHEALPKLKPGGLLILDNADSYMPRNLRSGKHRLKGEALPPPCWVTVLERFSSWRTIRTTNGLWETRFWVKPERVLPK
jgi:hypothetical protein